MCVLLQITAWERDAGSTAISTYRAHQYIFVRVSKQTRSRLTAERLRLDVPASLLSPCCGRAIPRRGFAQDARFCALRVVGSLSAKLIHHEQKIAA